MTETDARLQRHEAAPDLLAATRYRREVGRITDDEPTVTRHEAPRIALREERIEVAPGIELAVRGWHPIEAGPRPPILLVHGLASNARTWDGVAGILAAVGHEVAAVDLRGHGRSSKPDDGFDFETVTDDLRTLIESLGLDRPIAMGQSWGGNLVVELGARYPSLTRAVVGVDGGLIELSDRFPDWEECARLLAPPRLIGTPVAAIEAHLRSAHPDWPETGIAGTLANFEVRVDGTVAPWLTRERHMKILRALWEHHPSGRLADYPVPLLLVSADGTDDMAAAKRRAAERAEAAGRRIRVTWFPGADHDIHAQMPDRLARVVLHAVADGFLA